MRSLNKAEGRVLCSSQVSNAENTSGWREPPWGVAGRGRASVLLSHEEAQCASARPWGTGLLRHLHVPSWRQGPAGEQASNRAPPSPEHRGPSATGAGSLSCRFHLTLQQELRGKKCSDDGLFFF